MDSLAQICKKCGITEKDMKILKKHLSVSDRDTLNEVLYMLRTTEVKDLNKILENFGDIRMENFLSLPNYELSASLRFFEVTNKIRGYKKINGIYSCPRCKSKNTNTISVQIRSSDEPMTDINSCNDCGYDWTKN